MTFAVRRGQAMVESVFAVLVISVLFVALFCVSYMTTVKTMTEYAASRVARAHTVGLNSFMCDKAARVALIPVAGKLTRFPGLATKDFIVELDEEEIEEIKDYDPYDCLLSAADIYMQTSDEAEAAGCLMFERWPSITVRPGATSKVSITFELMDYPVTISGESQIELNYPDYLSAL